MQQNRLCRVALIGLALASLVIAGCRSKTNSLDFDSVVVDVLRFPHQRHTSVACIECHELESVLKHRTPQSSQTRPGGQNHKSCSAVGCHAPAFTGKPTELCGLCHETISQTDTKRSTLVPYPPIAGKRQLPLRFAHDTHLNFERMESRLGFHIGCTDCHLLATSLKTTKMARPNHATCARCHAEEVQLDNALTMSNCLRCHDESDAGRSRTRKLIKEDVHFSHAAHRNDRKGLPIACSTCHNRSLSATAEMAGNHASPTMAVCVDCHNNRDRVPSSKRMARCESCHYTKSAGLSSLAPRSHMPTSEKPANHTRAFRRDHSSDAAATPNNCAQCHSMLSGNRRNTCDECHQILRPRDHNITFREYDHGLESITSPDRCITCHQVDFCTTCHQKRPRSHFPSIEFRRGGHALAASINMRSCVTCHRPSRDCSGFGCHQGNGI